MIPSATSGSTTGTEISILVTDKMSLAKTLRALEDDGYAVIDVLPCLRALIVYVTDEQLDTLREQRDGLWKKNVKPVPGNLLN